MNFSNLFRLAIQKEAMDPGSKTPSEAKWQMQTSGLVGDCLR